MSDDRLDAIKARADKRHGPGWLSADDCKWLIAEIDTARKMQAAAAALQEPQSAYTVQDAEDDGDMG